MNRHQSAEKFSFMPLKTFCAEEAMRKGVSPETIRLRLHHGYYPKAEIRRVNKRVVFVKI